MGVKVLPLKAHVDSINANLWDATKLAGSLQRLHHDAQALVLDRAE